MAEEPIFTLGPNDFMTGIRTGDFTDTRNGLFTADSHIASALYRPDAYQGLLRPPNGIYDVSENGLVDDVVASTQRDIRTNTQLFQMGADGHLYQSTTELVKSPFYNIAVAAAEKEFDLSAQDSVVRGIEFDGTGDHMYLAGENNGNIFEYNLSTQFDISTASIDDSLSVSTEDSQPRGIAFNGDGSKLYVAGASNTNIYSYNLSTNYDVSTGTSNNTLDVITNVSVPEGVLFNNDGTKLYIPDSTNKDIEEYTLSTAYDISSASHNATLDVSTEDTTPTSIAFNDDGTKLYMTGESGASFYSYDLSTAYDITSASFNREIQVGDQDGLPQSVGFNNDGSKMYMAGTQNDKAHQYDMNLNTDLRSDTQITAPANGMATFQPQNGTEYLYYTTNTSIGRWDLSGLYSTGWDDTWQTTDIETTVEKPMYQFQDRIYFANDSYVGFIGDNGSGGVEVNAKALDIPSKYHITSFSDDGRRLIIAATRQEQSGNVTSHAGSKIFFWDTNSDSWNKAWEMDQSTGVASIRTVRGTTYAIDITALYRLSYNRPPEEMVIFQPDEEGTALQEFSADSSYDQNNINGVANHQKMIAHREGVMWITQNENIAFYGKYTPEQLNERFDVMFGSYPGANIISSTTGRGFTLSGTSSYQTDEYDFGRITVGANKATEWIDLESRYNIKSVEVVFGYDLESGDELEISIVDADNSFNVFGTIDFATYGSTKRVRLFGTQHDVDSIKIDFEFVSGQTYIQKVSVYGDKVST